MGPKNRNHRCSGWHVFHGLHIVQCESSIEGDTTRDLDSPLVQICGTNIGATILLARVLQVWASNNDVDMRTRDGALYALALGSNYGAFTLTFSASLAGLLWRQILHQKGIHVRPRQFLLLNLPTSFVAMLCSSAILLGEVYIIDKNS